MLNNSVQLMPGVVIAATALLVFLVDMFVRRKGPLAWRPPASSPRRVAWAVARGDQLRRLLGLPERTGLGAVRRP
jgi:hypothetical protein